jgi:hypothetical protein
MVVFGQVAKNKYKFSSLVLGVVALINENSDE